MRGSRNVSPSGGEAPKRAPNCSVCSAPMMGHFQVEIEEGAFQYMCQGCKTRYELKAQG